MTILLARRDRAPTEHEQSMSETNEADTVDDAPIPELQFPTLDKFVENFICVIYERGVSPTSGCWCPQWWNHPEAHFRLMSLWQAWEHMHANNGPLAAAQWLVSYADPIMNQLVSPRGPFRSCSPSKGHNQWPEHPDGILPCDAPPKGLFTPR